MKKSFTLLLSVFMICMVGLTAASVDDGNPDINVEITPYIAVETVDETTGEIIITEDWGNIIEYSMELEDNLGDVDVEFYDFDEETGIIKLQINGNKWFAEEGEKKIIYGSDAILNVGDFKVEVTDVYFYGKINDDTDDGIFGSTSDDIPVEVFIRLSNGETKTLGQLDDKDGRADKINLEEYSNDDWFNSNFETESFELFIERIDTNSVIKKVDLDSEDADVNDYEHVKNNDNMIFYEIDENGLYIVTITYEEESLWGDEKETDVYFKLDVSGLDKDGDGSSDKEGEVLFTDTASIQEGRTWTKTLTVDGEWTNTGGLTVTKNENGAAFDYVFKAMTTGSYSPEFTSVDGDTGTVIFTVTAKPTSSNNDNVNVSQNNNPNNKGITANQNTMDKIAENKPAAAILLLAIIGLGFMLLRGGKKGGNNSVSSKSLIDREESILKSGGEDE